MGEAGDGDEEDSFGKIRRNAIVSCAVLFIFSWWDVALKDNATFLGLTIDADPREVRALIGMWVVYSIVRYYQSYNAVWGLVDRDYKVSMRGSIHGRCEASAKEWFFRKYPKEMLVGRNAEFNVQEYGDKYSVNITYLLLGDDQPDFTDGTAKGHRVAHFDTNIESVRKFEREYRIHRVIRSPTWMEYSFPFYFMALCAVAFFLHAISESW